MVGVLAMCIRFVRIAGDNNFLLITTYVRFEIHCCKSEREAYVWQTIVHFLCKKG